MLKLVAAAHGLAMNAWDMRNRQEGQTMAEYGVVLAVITLIVVVALTTLSGAIGTALDKVTAKL